MFLKLYQQLYTLLTNLLLLCYNAYLMKKITVSDGSINPACKCNASMRLESKMTKGNKNIDKQQADIKPIIVTYVRVSSKEQEREGFSIEAQEKLLSKYAKDNKLPIDMVFKDIETAKKTGRLGFTHMLEFLKTSHKSNPGSLLVIIAEKTDRLYRNLRDWLTLDELKAEIHLVKENVILSDASQSAERFMHGIRVLMARNYIENLSEETRKGMLEKAAQGIWPSFAPFGYRNALGPFDKKIIVPDEATAPIVKKIFDLYSTGNHSLQTIAQLVSKESFPRRKRRGRSKCLSEQEGVSAAGLPSQANPGKVNKSLIHKIVNSIIYTGDFVWDGKAYTGIHEPIISKQQFEKVRQLLSGNGRCPSRPAKHHFLFQGLVACGHCGCAYVAELKKQKYVYYHCTGNKGKCPGRYVREEELEKQFVATIEAIKLSDEVAKWVVKALQDSHADEKRHHQEMVSALRTEMGKIDGYLDTAYLDRLNNVISLEQFEKLTKGWRQGHDELQRKVAMLENVNRSYIDDGVRVLELSQRAVTLYKMQSVEEKRELLKILHSNSTWTDGSLECNYRKPFDLLAVTNLAYQREKALFPTKEGLFDIWLPGTDSNRRQGG